MSSNKVDIVIEERNFTVITDDSPEEIQASAKYVSDILVKVYRNNSLLSMQQAYILAALNIAHELYKEREQRRELENRLKAKSEITMNDNFGQAESEKIQDLENKLADRINEDEKRLKDLLALQAKLDEQNKKFLSMQKENEILKSERQKLINKLQENSGRQ